MSNYYDISPIQYVKFSHRATLREAVHILDTVGLLIILNDNLSLLGVITPSDVHSLSVSIDSELGDICNRNPYTLMISELGNSPFEKTPDYIKHIPVLTVKRKVVRLLAKDKPMKLIHGRQLLVDLVDRCQLRCPCCERGTGEISNTRSKMSIELFERIILKAKNESFDRIGLYNWSEPLLCNNLYEYLRIVNKAGLDCHFSSNFSLHTIKNLDAIMNESPGVIVSISGFSQEVYEKYHSGGKLDYVKENLRKASRLTGKGWISIKYLFFDYNQHEIPIAREFAESLGIGFSVMCAHGNPLENQSSKPRYEEQNTAGYYLSEYSPSDHLGYLGKTCCHEDNFAIDCNGDMHLCCVVPTHGIFNCGSYLDMSLQKFKKMREIHPYCSICEFGGKIHDTSTSFIGK